MEVITLLVNYGRGDNVVRNAHAWVHAAPSLSNLNLTKVHCNEHYLYSQF